MTGQTVFETLADNLWFPEGPVALKNGGVGLVEVLRGTITIVKGRGNSSVAATPGGGPNGMAVGPDGALYVCNNGGLETKMVDGMPVPTGKPLAGYTSGRIERIDAATGAVSVLYTRCGGVILSSPNDIVFDAHGGFYFTDLGKNIEGIRSPGGVFYALPDGSKIKTIAHPMPTMPNGCGLSPDGGTLYVSESLTARLLAFPVSAPGVVERNHTGPYGARILCELPPPAKFDSHAVDSEGNICVATLETGHVSVISPDGALVRQVAFPDHWVTNICFGGVDLRTGYVTLSKTGKLVSLRWPVPGLRLNYQS
jgi:gluconolactonase